MPNGRLGMGSFSTLNLTTGRSPASCSPSKRLETGFTREFMASWRVFLATFGILPVFTGPIPCRHLARWLRVALMPSPEASTPVWIGLLDGHLWVTIANRLGFPVLTSTHHEFLGTTRSAPRAVAG